MPNSPPNFRISPNAGYEGRRKNSNQRLYTRNWSKRRRLFLLQNPICRECAALKYTVPATVVDHIIPHRGNQELFDDETNWQPLCKTCHDIKTAKGL